MSYFYSLYWEGLVGRSCLVHAGFRLLLFFSLSLFLSVDPFSYSPQTCWSVRPTCWSSTTCFRVWKFSIVPILLHLSKPCRSALYFPFTFTCKAGLVIITAIQISNESRPKCNMTLNFMQNNLSCLLFSFLSTNIFVALKSFATKYRTSCILHLAQPLVK